MISRSFHLHVKIVMRSLENAVSSLNEAEKFTQYLMNLGERHERWSIKMEHFDVSIFYCNFRAKKSASGEMASRFSKAISSRSIV